MVVMGLLVAGGVSTAMFSVYAPSLLRTHRSRVENHPAGGGFYLQRASSIRLAEVEYHPLAKRGAEPEQGAGQHHVARQTVL